jgi:glycosyltransferase involved in cell wall biosynthesis
VVQNFIQGTWMMRVAFTLIGGKTWTGGANFLLNLLNLTSTRQPGRVTPVLFVGDDTPTEAYRQFRDVPGVVVIATSLLNENRHRRSLLSSVLFGRDKALTGLFRLHDIDVVFESARYFGWRLGLPAVAWIPDMQHRRLPQFFTFGGRLKRELGFRLQNFGGRRIMVSSDDSRRAFEHYYPSAKGRVGVVHFAIEPGPRCNPASARSLADSYGLPEQYFFMPNQFWRHKNHSTVLDAIAMLKRGGCDVVIAASGMQSDPRDPHHFPALTAKINALNLKDNFRLLGMVPYPHLAPLMVASSAVINASLSEGWSTTVEEAKSLGIPLIVSNLDVHREQLGDNASYFDPQLPASIADSIVRFKPASNLDREALAEAARQDSADRIDSFVNDFCRFMEAGQKDR